MEIKHFSELIKTESIARKYLLGFCWKNHQRYCPRCRQRKLYKLAEGRRRCSRCGYTFHDFSSRFINIGDFSSVEWLWMLKFFELETPPRVVAGQMGVSRNTAEKGLRTIRQAIMAHALDAPLYVQTGLIQGASATSPPVFGVMERRGWVFVDLLQGIGPEGLAHFRSNFHLGSKTLGKVVYTDRYRHYDTLVFCAPDEKMCAPFRGGKGSAGVYVEGRQGFWTYVRERLRLARGFGFEQFPLHFKELEFRYNHRQEDVFPLLARFVCGIVPDRKKVASSPFDQSK